MEKIKNNIIIDTSGCWIWQKSCSSSGYGQFTIDGVYWNTHRYVWQKYNGDIREMMLLDIHAIIKHVVTYHI